MKTMNGLRVALGVAIAAVSISAWAQDGASAGASAGTASRQSPRLAA